MLCLFCYSHPCVPPCSALQVSAFFPPPSGNLQVQGGERLAVRGAPQDLTVRWQTVLQHRLHVQPPRHRCPALPRVLPQGQRLHFCPFASRAHAAGNICPQTQLSACTASAASSRKFKKNISRVHLFLKMPYRNEIGVILASFIYNSFALVFSHTLCLQSPLPTFSVPSSAAQLGGDISEV